jgi:mono/diheme cytochrome c family protein
MRKRTFVPMLLVAACSAGPRLPRAPAGTPELEIRGALEGGPFSLGRADLERLPRRTLRGVDPETGTEAAWTGPSVATIVSERVELAKGADTAIARTADGGAIAIPLTVIRQLKPVLADRVDGVRTARRILAWPTMEQRGLETDPRARGWWVRDVVAFEIADWQRTFGPALATPDGAPDGARRGAATFGDRCISCHRLRGAGGQRGPDLTTVAARIRPGPFGELLERHPGTRAAGGERDSEMEAADLWSFLRAVAVAGLGARVEELTADRAAPDPATR